MKNSTSSSIDSTRTSASLARAFRHRADVERLRLGRELRRLVERRAADRVSLAVRRFFSSPSTSCGAAVRTIIGPRMPLTSW